MGQPWCDPLTNELGIFVVLWSEAGEIVKDEYLTPLSALTQGSEQLFHGGHVDLYEEFSNTAGLIDLYQDGNSIGYNHCVGVTKKFP